MMYIAEMYLTILNLVKLCENYSYSDIYITVKMGQYFLILIFSRPEFDRFI